MPELPEVETMRRRAAAAAGSRIVGLRRPRSKLRPIRISPPLAAFRRRVTGRTILSVARLGKRIVLALDAAGGATGDLIVLEPRMTGLVLTADPPDQKHLRLVFSLRKTGSPSAPRELLFWDSRGLGEARLLRPAEFARRCGPAAVGPDALDISPAELRRRLADSRRPIKPALLDQRALAGVGNIYASEILHLARIHPATPCRRLAPAQWRRLHAAMGRVLREAVRRQGSTLGDGTYRLSRRRSGSYQLHHRVYQRAGKPCPRCGPEATIVRLVQAQRSTFFCPRCQRAD